MKYVKLKEICDLQNGYAFKSSDYIDESNVLNCRMSNIRPNASFDIEYSPKYLPEEFAEKYREYLLNDGDLVIAMTDLANDPKILGVPTIVNTKGYQLLLNQRVGKLIIKNKKLINEKYLKYALSLPQHKSYYKKFAGGGLQINIGKEHILNIEIPITEYENQIKIVNILNKSQELIDKRKEQIGELDKLIKSKFIEMFGNLKDEGKLPLEKCSTFIDYRGKTPTLSESGIRIINAKSVGNGFFKYIDEYISEETYDSWMKRGFPVAGDVLFVTEGHTFGNVCRIPNDLKKFAMGQRVITMQGKGGLLNNIFLAQYMQSMAFKIDIYKYKTGSSAQGIRSKELQKILIPIPNIELQNQFADFVKQVDKLKFEMEKSLKELEDNFNSLMQKAFKGELFN